MSRVTPADRRKRKVVLMVGPPSLPRTKSQSEPSAGVPESIGGSSPPSSTETSSREDQRSPRTTTIAPSTTAEEERDPHNEVERRRKLRISQNVKALAETLSPPCHCGRATRAEILEMVVKKIEDLQQKNTELESRLKDLPSPTEDCKEQSCKAIALVEENLQLRALLLAAFSGEESTQNGLQSRDKVEQEQNNGERGGETKSVDRAPLPSESVEEREGEPEVEISVETTSDAGEGGEDSGGGEVRDGETDSSESERRRGVEGEGDYGKKEKGQVDKSVDGEDMQSDVIISASERPVEMREMGNGGSKDRVSTAADQTWPMSSLLSDQTQSGGPRDHPVVTTLLHGLPILSPTYIAEHCSNSGCTEQQFFGPHSLPILPPAVTAASTTDTTPLSYAEPVPSSIGTRPSTVHVPQFVAQTTTISSSSSSLSSAVSTIPHSFNSPISSHHQQHTSSQLTRQSIVQPWVGSITTISASNSRTTQHSGTVQNASSLALPPQTVTEQHYLPTRTQPQPKPPAPSSNPHQHRISSLTRHSHTSRQSRYTSSRAGHTQTASGRGHSHTAPYLHTNHQILQPSRHIGSFPTMTHSQQSHPNLPCDGRGQPYYSVGNPSLSTSPFLGHTTSPLMSQSTSLHRQQFGLHPSPVDPYYQCGPVAFEPHHTAPSLPLPHCHTSQGSSHPHFSPHTPHYPHHHTYSIHPPPPSHPIPPPPQFPLHQHTHSHHNTVWRPYSDRPTTRFSLSDILSPSPTPLGLPAVVSPPAMHQQARIPSFFVDHLLDDL